MRFNFILFCCGWISSSSASQAQLVGASEVYPLWTNHTSGYLGAGMSVADYTGDGWDDATFVHHGGILYFYRGTGTGFVQEVLPVENGTSEAKGVLWADFDNDGDQDLLVANRLASNTYWRNDGGGFWTDVSYESGLDLGPSRSYGLAAGDFDRDGFLDLFIANYVHNPAVEAPKNELYRNLGNGFFQEVTEQAGLTGEITQCFQGQWVDFNEDGWLDLHVIRDRLMFANLYYENQQDGTFIERAADVGLDVMLNAMSTSVADFDRDNDMDVYVTGALEGNKLLVNTGGVFALYEPPDGTDSVVMNDWCWAANWMDYDNDGWDDLHVTTGYTVATQHPEVYTWLYRPDWFFRNDSGTFDLATEEVLGTVNNLSFAAAPTDINRDGTLDFISHRVQANAQVLMGTPAPGNWLRILPQGTDSNRDGIGTKVRVYVDGQVIYRMSTAGENYLGQNSRWLHFGLGPAAIVDSIQFVWPLGLEEWYYAVPGNQFWTVVEGASAAIDACPEGEICYGCIYSAACNFDAGANTDDGSCDFSCCTGPSACGPGTLWDSLVGVCLPVPISQACHADLNVDGTVTVGDLMLFLEVFSQTCPP